jgi:hypothetical protein
MISRGQYLLLARLWTRAKSLAWDEKPSQSLSSVSDTAHTKGGNVGRERKIEGRGSALLERDELERAMYLQRPQGREERPIGKAARRGAETNRERKIEGLYTTLDSD